MSFESRFDLEGKIAELEALIARLENENLSVDEAVSVYAQGLNSLVECRAALKSLTERVDLIRAEAEEKLKAIDEGRDFSATGKSFAHVGIENNQSDLPF